MIERDYLVVGAGTAGVSVCEGIRQYDKRGKITLVGNEMHPPYERRALSKRFLSHKDYAFEEMLPPSRLSGTRSTRSTCGSTRW